MSKSSPHKVNKSQAIRDALAKQPSAKAKDIVALLSKQGIKVPPAMVYMQMTKTRRAKRPQKQAKAVAESSQQPQRSPVVLVARVKEIARDLGGFNHLRQLVDLLAD